MFLDCQTLHVGRVGLSATVTSQSGATLRFGETLAEVCEPPDAYPGKLGGQWLNPVPTIVGEGGRLTHTDRRAFRYLRIDGATVGEVEVIAESSAGEDRVGPPSGLDPVMAEIDRVAIHTLRNCTQSVFEDGPKRDRRLWLGDLRLQAMVDAVSFRRFDLVKRCLYLFAACAREDGVVPPCVYEKPRWHAGPEFIPDYAMLFGPTLLDYLYHSGDRATAADLWPVALAQVRVIDRYCGDDGLFNAPREVWQFIDWCDDLDRQAAEQATAIYSLGRLHRLGRLLGVDDRVLHDLAQRRARLRDAAGRLYHLDCGFYLSGPSRQVSWASQVWMILAGVFEGPSARAAMQRLLDGHDAVRPVSPYLWHHVVEALVLLGMDRQAAWLIRDYWGGMVRRGADTFWEVYVPGRERLSPYGSHLHNSYCHAWSCTPACFIRRGLAGAAASPSATPMAAALR